MWVSSLASERTGKTSDRVIGAVVLCLALALWAIVIPDQVDRASYGWMRPRTMPSICAAVIGALGLLLIVFPKGAEPPDWPAVGRIACVALIALAAAWLIARLGFIYAASPVALALALLTGERRWSWLVMAAALVPLIIWGTVTILGRPLP